ncbi:hypothetical protein LOH54_09610 [Sulfurimonas sp. HSL-3221]|uniref:hypothetical protein n=1 Tax=Sulfurimonadaceae TaxID=2771471 RepID=UPI001E2C3697|nr:hypothetical protein [Sulfurimonas sp. HSL-3221]UFS61911.1 hypothetical protein LOH54_09610 [Sulfurimonas sp. HSL-3221]
MNHVKSIASGLYLGTAGITMMSVLSGCVQEQQEHQNRYLIVQQQAGGKYVVVEEMPTEGPNRAIIREYDANGTMTERFMNEAEMKALAQQEYDKMQAGQSELNQPPQGEGMGLAGTILAVAAGSLLGNMIGNALMNNANYRQHADRVNKSAYHATQKAKASSSKKSFFGGTKTGTSSTSSTTYGG